ncbi:molybdenum cofactor biosynthesis protein MoaE [Corynebacterium striatum]|uniref:Molybdopterin converting factor n=1 Tax=Corynebacterium striatum TaxID=43770 RepID=A0ABC8CPM6_CORST|nr:MULTISPECIES: molybdenum cofactor biosynthesis protein MoaE [Corynebacterium]ATZ09128.1 molybdopterin converting factor [Corynebacterium striatum]EGT5590980.1 molybdenum cofactor biosynthesis protein MoaE [Corynebacterium striatum]EGT5611687.1 molybdenum cofactor biosynthesis protein MoaE [Corynebacterium striatum]KAA1270063.1 molybdenum cofactor biosynthesis protein MoaE [Corynebacterium striatum]MBD0855188.1 molybdopterin converting factor [Corynebacterium striatum]
MSTDPSYVSADTGKVLGAFMTAEPIEYPEVATAAMGAVVTFEGIVRNHDGGRGGVELLTYTAHPSADAEIARVADEVIAAHPKARLWCAHRTGDLHVGDAAFVVIAAAAHRHDAFAAAAECADRVKAEVPIWKEQRHADGFSNWVGLE